MIEPPPPVASMPVGQLTSSTRLWPVDVVGADSTTLTLAMPGTPLGAGLRLGRERRRAPPLPWRRLRPQALEAQLNPLPRQDLEVRSRRRQIPTGP